MSDGASPASRILATPKYAPWPALRANPEFSRAPLQGGSPRSACSLGLERSPASTHTVARLRMEASTLAAV